MTNDPELSAPVQDLLKDVRAHFPAPITLQVDDNASGRITHDAAQQEMQKDGSMVLHVYDATDLDYTVSHELLHIEMYLKGFPAMSLPVTTGDPKVDDQISATAVSIHNSASHLVIGAEQRRMGVITNQTEQAFISGISDIVPAEPTDGTDDGHLFYRVLTLLDGLAFFADNEDHLPAEWLQMYPEAFKDAQRLYATMTAKVIDSPFAVRRAIVKTFKDFDALLDELGYVPMPHDQFCAIAPVLSQRQLKLEFRQVYDILHSDFVNRTTKEKAFLAIGKSDRQMAFALPLKTLSQDDALKIYDRTTEDVLKQFGITFALRN